jgi:hypothetical protein
LSEWEERGKEEEEEEEEDDQNSVRQSADISDCSATSVFVNGL